MKNLVSLQEIYFALLAGLLCFACSLGTQSLDLASTQYRATKEYSSLETIYNYISNSSVPRKEVERLLGEPDYSPIDGVYYYSSDKDSPSKISNGDISVGLIIDYRDENHIMQTYPQQIWLGPIEE